MFKLESSGKKECRVEICDLELQFVENSEPVSMLRPCLEIRTSHP